MAKKCKHCGIEKPADLEHFYRAKTTRDGLQPHCKACHKKRGRELAILNADKRRETRLAWAQRPDVRERERIRWKLQREADPNGARLRVRLSYYRNRQKRLDARRRHGIENREKELIYNTAWRRNNPLRVKMISARSAARRHGCIIEKVVPEQVIARCKSTCGICGKPVSMEDLTFDHIIPMCKNGPHSEHNLQVAHYECNRWKNAKSMGDIYKGVNS